MYYTLDVAFTGSRDSLLNYYERRDTHAYVLQYAHIDAVIAEGCCYRLYVYRTDIFYIYVHNDSHINTLGYVVPIFHQTS